jgi:hypothetical protein
MIQAFVFTLLISGNICYGDDSYKFYIYNWPISVQSSWPDTDATMYIPQTRSQHGHPHYKPNMCNNFGHGAQVDAANGLYATNSFCLYVMIMGRLRVHPRRTFNRSEADIFVIPHDVGIAAQWDKSNGKYLMHQVNGSPQNETVFALLRTELAKSSFYGHDHLVLNSLFDMFNPSCLEFFLLCGNCTVVAQDVQFVDHYTNRVSKSMGRPLGRRWYAAPYVSSFHWNEGIERFPWMVDRSQPKQLVAVWGSVAVQNRQAARLRSFLKLDCELHIDDCYHVGISNRKGAVGHVTCSDTITKDCIPKENASVAMSGLEAYNSSGEAHYSSCYP